MEKDEILAIAARLADFAARADEQRAELFSIDAHPFTLREAAMLHQALEKVRLGLMEVSQIADDLRHRAAQQE